VNALTVEPKISQYQSFLLRFWQVAEADNTVAWYGEIESIQTGQEWKLADPDKLLAFLQPRASHEQTLQSEQEE
jgi:hypothetical protein